MTTTREMEIFADALEISNGVERQTMLDRVCAEDVRLRGRVEELLMAHSKAGVFFSKCKDALASSAEIALALNELEAAAPSGETGDDALGSAIGPYQLLQRIGEGGCGTVYMAQQDEPMRRRVALKIIKLGMDTRSVIARFGAERQALAMMEHPSIARALDAGATQTGRPFFVMELVPGVRITEYCNANQLTTVQRLKLFVQVCQAIQHAHHKGIIHRDIKPSNVLVASVDGAPLPKIIDFGIAKAVESKLTDLTLFTLHGHFIGTPAYMSPEQAQLGSTDIDTRSDIYSLGVLLYEMLTGKTPFEQKELLAAGLDGMQRTLRERQPHRPSIKLDGLTPAELTLTAQQRLVEPGKLRSELRGDLDWIVMKALEKDRRRRYETANALARDVDRYLRREPVAARPPSAAYHFARLIQRNSLLFTAVGAFGLALVIGLCLSTWLYVREREARRFALAAEQKQVRLREEADRLRGEAEVRQKLTKATLLLSQNQIEEADALVTGITNANPNLEYANLYRRLGNWNVSKGLWKQAADRFEALGQMGQPEELDSRDSLRSGYALIRAGDHSGYKRFRETLIARHSSTTNLVVAERVIRASTLLPTDELTLQALEPLKRTAEKIDEITKKTPPSVIYVVAWRLFSLALLEYRRGHFEAALDLCERASGMGDRDLVRNANFYAVKGLAYQALGRSKEATAAFARCREIVETQPGFQAMDFWFDWLSPRILLEEAGFVN